MSDATQVILTPDMSTQDCAVLMQSGAVSMDAFLENEAARQSALKASATTRTARRITISPAGNMSFNGIRRKGEGPLYSSIEDIPAIVELMPECIAKGIAASSIIVPADATQRVQRDGWKKGKPGCTDDNRFVDAKHPRAGQSQLRFREGTDQAQVVKALRSLAEFFGVTDAAIDSAHAELTKHLSKNYVVILGFGRMV